MRRCVAVLTSTYIAGCVSYVGAPVDTEFAMPRRGEGLDCSTPQVPLQPLRRLSSEQYANTIRDLFGGQLGDDLVFRSEFPGTTVSRGFHNDAGANTVSTAESMAIEDHAAGLAAYLLANAAQLLPQTVPCVPAGFTDSDVDACIDGFIDEFGRRASRRPLTPAEAAVVRQVYDRVRAEQPAAEAWSAVLQFFLQSPALLYRVERGREPGTLRVRGFEMATRLSYLFLNSTPDAELMRAAAAGELDSDAGVVAQARRLAAQIEPLRIFHRDLLALHRLNGATHVTPSLSASLQEELSRLLERIAAPRLADLFGGSRVVVNSELEAIYGVEAGSTGPNDWREAEAPNRRGLLTSASFMAALADATGTHPVRRGVFILSSVLCVPVPPLPENLDTATPLADTASLPTARQRLAPQVELPSCAGCHSYLNPLGYALENYDERGAWRDTENGAPIDASGELGVMREANGPFAGPLDFVDRIVGSSDFRECYSRQWLRFAMGRSDAPEDECSVRALVDSLERSDGSLPELLVALVTTDAFLYRRGEP